MVGMTQMSYRSTSLGTKRLLSRAILALSLITWIVGPTDRVAAQNDGIFIRGDVNQDGELTEEDACGIDAYLDAGECVTAGCSCNVNCFKTFDANDDGTFSDADSDYIRRFLMGDGPPPPPPYPTCGTDPTPDDLTCESFEQSLCPRANFVRSDVDGDGRLTMVDLQGLRAFIDTGESAFECDDRLDVNDDGVVDGGDVAFLSSWLTEGITPPARPFPYCGSDADSSDDLTCQEFPLTGCPVPVCSELPDFWAARAGGTSADVMSPLATAIGPVGNTIVVGRLSGSVTFEPSRRGAALELARDCGAGPCDDDIFVAKVNALGEWIWAQRAGGSNADTAEAVAVDHLGNVYVSGSFQGTATFGRRTLVNSVPNESAMFIAKLDPEGNWLWVRRVGGAQLKAQSEGLAVAVQKVDASISGPENVAVYVGGELRGSGAQFDFDGLPSVTITGARSGLVARLDKDGAWEWVRLLDCSCSRARITDVAVDGAANVFVSGAFAVNVGSATFFPSPAGNGLDVTPGSFGSIFVAKLSPEAEPLWVNTAHTVAAGGGLLSSLSAPSLATDAAGNLYLAGGLDLTSGSNLRGHVEFGHTISFRFHRRGQAAETWDNSLTLGAGELTFLAKITNDGQWVWRTADLGSIEEGVAVAVDDSGGVYFGGHALPSFCDLFDADDRVDLTRRDATAVARIRDLGDRGELEWLRRIQSTSRACDLLLTSVLVDRTGNVVTTGRFRSEIAFGGPLEVVTTGGEVRVLETREGLEGACIRSILPMDSGFGTFVAKAEPVGQWLTTDFDPFVIGREVEPPAGAIARKPEIEVLEPLRPDTTESNAFFWSTVEEKLYAVRPCVALLKWFRTDAPDDPTRIEVIGTNIFPQTTVQVHVSGAPVDLEVDGSPFKFAGLFYTESAAEVVGTAFDVDEGHSGYSVLVYADTRNPEGRDGIDNDGDGTVDESDEGEIQGDAADLQKFPPHFVVVRSTRFEPSANGMEAVIGGRLSDADHVSLPDDPKNGFVLFELSRYDAGTHDRDGRRGPIIPVNEQEPAEPFVVVWYRPDQPTGVLWPEKPVQYDCVWPAEADFIDLADGLGSQTNDQESLDPAKFPGMEIYNQPDRALPGFNPNEEHALFAPENTDESEFPALFALRDDLGDPPGATEVTTSEPYVLLRYRDADDGDWRIKVYRVERSDFDGLSGKVGNPIQPPYPLGLLRTCAESGGTGETDRHWFVDYKGALWGKSAGLVGAQFWYPLRPGFYYPFDFDGDGFVDAEPGECVPFLALVEPGPEDSRELGEPIVVEYAVTWPEDLPVLNIGDTLTKPKLGLPNIIGQAAVDVVYDETAGEDPSDPLTGLTILDPLTPRSAALDELPIDERGTEVDPASGKTRLIDLPAHLFLRLAYDPVASALTFGGHFDESGAGDPLLLLNVMTAKDRDEIFALDSGAPWRAVVDELYKKSRNPLGADLNLDGRADEILLGLQPDLGGAPLQGVDGNAALGEDGERLVFQDREGNPILDAMGSSLPLRVVKASPAGVPLALSAGVSAREGYVTLAFNNNLELDPSPVSVEVIRVECPPHVGQIKVIDSLNVFGEALTLRHSGDFGGDPGRFLFEWWIQPDRGGTAPRIPRSESELRSQWSLFDAGDGLDQITIRGATPQTLSDNWFIVRYNYGPTGSHPDPSYPCEPDVSGEYWSGFAGAPGGDRAQLAEGWIKRVIRKLNPFDSRVLNFRDSPTNTFVSIIGQLGQRFEGAIPFNSDPENLNDIGLIEAYETVLRRGLDLSIDGEPPVDDVGANTALLLITSRLSDFYTLLGNEAFADAVDPTIGFGTDSSLGSRASSLFSFMNQMASPLEEELTLLRGRDDEAVTVQAPPVYNRLYWNMTLAGEGEVAYVNSHMITDQNSDGVVDEKDARTLYPQGHGDAWGHYLTAIGNYYDLLRHPRFTWLPRTENVLVADVPVLVDFLDERKFTRVAAARARVGLETVDLTYRQNYVEDPDGQWQGYKDTDEERAWGVDGWARRAGQGAYFDWVVANALLPAEDTEHAGIQRIDRTTVSELHEIPTHFGAIQSRVDEADLGLNPLGLPQGTVPFDIAPSEIDEGKTHFEQIQERALEAMGNAFVAFDHANQNSQELRQLQETTDGFREAVDDRELDFTSRLIEIFGYPYADDIGPGGAYPSGYNGPDLLHFDYVDPSALLTEGNPTAGGQSDPRVVQVRFTLRDYVLDPLSGVPRIDDQGRPVEGPPREVDFNISTNGFGLVRPAHWTAPRRAPGEVQLARSELLQSLGRYEQALRGYDALVLQIQNQVRRLELVRNLNAEEIALRSGNLDDAMRFNRIILTLTGTQLGLQRAGQLAQSVTGAVAAALPDVVGTSNDALGPAQAGIRLIGEVGSVVLGGAGDILGVISQGLEQAKQEAQLSTDLEITVLGNAVEDEQELLTLEQLVRGEAQTRLEIFTLFEATRQAAGAYLAAIARGQRVLVERERFRKLAASSTQEHRYQDMAFRIFRNDAIQKYRAQFDLAARYVYLAAKAYDYETNLLSSDSRAGKDFLTDVVRQRGLGEFVGGVPIVGTPGLADVLGRMGANFGVLRSQLGFNNPQTETNRFSLRRELFRIGHGESLNATWRQKLLDSGVYREDLWELPEFRRYCRPFAPSEAGAQPGLVIRFSTSVAFGLNFFGWPLEAGDSSYDPSNFSTKIRSVGVWFSNFDLTGLANTPRVYLVPAGMDRLRSPTGDAFEVRDWLVRDQKLPTPFSIGPQALEEPEFIPVVNSLSEDLGGIRRFSSFRAYHDAREDFETEMIVDSRLVGRSVWNTEWLLIIPGATLLHDPVEGLETFIRGRRIGGSDERDGRGVSDILIFFQTYTYSGN